MARKPTLHEKVSIKGKLEQKGVVGPNIASLDNFKTVFHYWGMCYGPRNNLLKFFKGREAIKKLMEG